jgi:trypsin
MTPQTIRRWLTTVLVAVATTAATLALNTSPASAIVGGEPIAITDVPWQVSLQDSSGHFCGGSVIGPSLILTAAHCTEGTSPSSITVHAGIGNLSDATGQVRDVTKIFENGQYFTTGTSDAAVLVLASPLTFDATVQQIALATDDDVAIATAGGTTAITTGWGATREDEESPSSEQLLVAEVPLIDDEACAIALAAEDAEFDPATETCAGGTGADSCYGDSGGPMVVVAADGAPRLVGVVSWGIECGGASPGVYADVAGLGTWIASITPDTPATDRPVGTGGGGEWDDGDWDDDEGWDDIDWYWDDEYWDDGDWDDEDYYPADGEYENRFEHEYLFAE